MGYLYIKKCWLSDYQGKVFLRKLKKRLEFDYMKIYAFYMRKCGINNKEKVDTGSYMQVGDCGLISIIFKEFFQVEKKVKKLSRVFGVFELKYLNHSIDSMQEGCQ